MTWRGQERGAFIIKTALIRQEGAISSSAGYTRGSALHSVKTTVNVEAPRFPRPLVWYIIGDTDTYFIPEGWEFINN